MTPAGNSRFDFGVDFIARVDNTLANQNGQVLRNGGSSTVTNVSYIDERLSTIVLAISACIEPVATNGMRMPIGRVESKPESIRNAGRRDRRLPRVADHGRRVS